MPEKVLDEHESTALDTLLSAYRQVTKNFCDARYVSSAERLHILQRDLGDLIFKTAQAQAGGEAIVKMAQIRAELKEDK